MPPFMHNHGNYIASLGNVCRWLATQAEALGVEIYPGMAASDAGVRRATARSRAWSPACSASARTASPGRDYQPGMELHGKYVFIGEGVRGSLAKVLQAKFDLCEDADPQKYGIGIKELWQVPDEIFQPGPGAAHLRLAAGRQDRRRLLHVPLRRQLRGHRLRGAPELQEPLALAVRRVPALQAPPGGPPSTWRAASASPTARAPSPRAACSRCRSCPSRAAC